MTDPAFSPALALTTGVLVYRVEHFALSAVELGAPFFSGDCYLVYAASPERKDLWLWLGAESSLDEQGTLALKAVELDAALKGAPHQHRVEQGREDPEFLALFRAQEGGFRVQAGGAASAFAHVSNWWETPLDRLPQLLRLRAAGDASRECATASVAVAAASLCATDVAVLDTGSTVFLWMGKQSPVALCQAGFALCAKFKVSRAGGCETVVLSRTDTAPALRSAQPRAMRATVLAPGSLPR